MKLNLVIYGSNSQENNYRSGLFCVNFVRNETYAMRRAPLPCILLFIRVGQAYSTLVLCGKCTID